MARRLNDEAPSTIKKESALRHEGYRRLVASMACEHCGRVGASQAAHADQGKGAGIKTDDRTCWPACSTAPGRPGCHDIIGGSGALGKLARRDLEARYAASTRRKLIERGLWPADLSRWPGEVAE